MFNKILLVYSEKLTQKHLEVVEEIKKIFHNEGKRVCVVKATDLQKEFFDNIDLVITAGGDGAFIRASHYIKDIPILGINSEQETSEGALLSIKDNELDALKEILNGKHEIQEIPRISIKKNNELLDELAVNEVYIGSKNQFHTSCYIIEHNGNKEEHKSSGVLIATGTGSSAWYKSAGGVPFQNNKKLRFLVREPFVSRVFSPGILNGEIGIGEKICFEAKRHEGGVIAIDSNKTYDFNVPDKIEISISDKPLRVIVRK